MRRSDFEERRALGLGRRTGAHAGCEVGKLGATWAAVRLVPCAIGRRAGKRVAVCHIQIVVSIVAPMVLHVQVASLLLQVVVADWGKVRRAGDGRGGSQVLGGGIVGQVEGGSAVGARVGANGAVGKGIVVAVGLGLGLGLVESGRQDRGAGEGECVRDEGSETTTGDETKAGLSSRLRASRSLSLAGSLAADSLEGSRTAETEARRRL